MIPFYDPKNATKFPFKRKDMYHADYVVPLLHLKIPFRIRSLCVGTITYNLTEIPQLNLDNCTTAFKSFPSATEVTTENDV